MLTTGLIAAIVGTVLAVALLGYVVGYGNGKRAERRRWQRRISGEAREVGRTLATVRRALNANTAERPYQPPKADLARAD
jgi:hypothetical protein